MADLILIRHGLTQGNLDKRYIGRTDEPLCPEGERELRVHAYPGADLLYASPLLRCRQTAQILYPGLTPLLSEDLRECDFGAFEGKNYEELNGNPDYQAWIDSGGTLPFPGGESQQQMRERCASAFAGILKSLPEGDQRIVLVVHGGTIMALLERFAMPKRPFWDWHAENGNGYRCTLKDGVITVEGKLW